MKVLFFLAGDEHRASTRLRVLNFLPYLDRAGIGHRKIDPTAYAGRTPGPDEVGYALSISELIASASLYDVVYLQKVPLPGPLMRYLSAVSEVVYDFDDALYATPAWETDRRFWHSYLDGTLQRASVVVAGNPVLLEYARERTDHVRFFPTTLPRNQYPEERLGEGGEAKTVTIGWIGNPENLHYLEAATDPIAEVLDEYKEARLDVITAGPEDRPVEPLADRTDVTYRQWSLDRELDLLSRIDVGIRPLFDDEWTRGKGGFTSVVQMMALGIPVVVRPVGWLADLVEHGGAGFHATDDDEWIDACGRLIEDRSLRTRTGKCARRSVGDQRLWTESRADDWIETFRSLAT